MAQPNDRVESDAYDTPTVEVVAHSFSELETLLTGPRAAGESILVRLEGPAAEQILGEGMAVRVVGALGEAVAR